MKKIVALFLACCSILTVNISAWEKQYSNLDIVEGIGTTISDFGIYGDFHAENLYLQTLAGIMDKHPELYSEILKELLSSKDPYGQYYTPEERVKILESLSDNIEGIGVNITLLDGNLMISQVIKGTPAEKAGLKEGDIIVSANGTPLVGMDLDVATSYIKGSAGTPVNIVVKRSGKELPFTIIRQQITTTPVEYEIFDTGIGYIKISSFSQNSAQYFNEALNEFGFKNIKNIIIDVRNNGGGYLNEAVEIADYFLPNGKTIITEDHKVDLLDEKYVASGPASNYNVVILINEYSASASEVLCAALTENEAAVSIGKKSYGKGTVQNMVNLPDGGLMKYTTAFYLTPLGNNVEGKGISPDISVENPMEALDISQFNEPKYKYTYSVGMSDPEIKNVKEILKFLGIYHGEVNEYYDENLQIAVSAIQKSSNYIPQTGVLDPATQIEILEMMCDTKIVIDKQLEEAKAYFTE